MPCPLYIVQAFDARSGLTFFHEATFNGDDLWSVACQIAAGSYAEHRIDAVRCFDPLTERMKDVTYEALNHVVSKCAYERRRVPENVCDALAIYCVRIPEGLLPDYRVDARELQMEAA